MRPFLAVSRFVGDNMLPSSARYQNRDDPFFRLACVGPLVTDHWRAELKYLQSGIAVLKFSVGVNKTLGKGEDKRQTTTWFNVTVWRERAEVLHEYIKKGMQVLVTGEIGLSPYIGKDGKPNASLELTADDVKLLTSKQEMERRAAEEYDTAPQSRKTGRKHNRSRRRPKLYPPIRRGNYRSHHPQSQACREDWLP
jgi:single-strand DNA-binding protein